MRPAIALGQQSAQSSTQARHSNAEQWGAQCSGCTVTHRAHDRGSDARSCSQAQQRADGWVDAAQLCGPMCRDRTGSPMSARPRRMLRILPALSTRTSPSDRRRHVDHRDDARSQNSAIIAAIYRLRRQYADVSDVLRSTRRPRSTRGNVSCVRIVGLLAIAWYSARPSRRSHWPRDDEILRQRADRGTIYRLGIAAAQMVTDARIESGRYPISRLLSNAEQQRHDGGVGTIRNPAATASGSRAGARSGSSCHAPVQCSVQACRGVAELELRAVARRPSSARMASMPSSWQQTISSHAIPATTAASAFRPITSSI